ncbi:MAG: prepilin-type N-terminal cleavage/methylation domain-containing protein [Phycisphaerales bacterium]|nr:prepilin-type N-terminal cleavage/methylation domain-containing protein [Phycisphaerales bacterium]
MVIHPPHRPCCRGRTGFTLIEAIVGSVILALALVSILGLTGQALASQRRGEQLRDAAMLIDEQLNLVLAVGPEDFRRVFDAKGRCPEPFEDYSYEVKITSRGDGNPYQVIATVSWESGGRNQELSVETLVAARLGDDPDPDRLPPTTVTRDQS